MGRAGSDDSSFLFLVGSILEGPDVEKLKPLLLQAMPLLIQLLNDQQTVVRDSAAWCVGRVCDICQDVVVNQQILQMLLPALSQGLVQEPRVAANVCWVSAIWISPWVVVLLGFMALGYFEFGNRGLRTSVRSERYWRRRESTGFVYSISVLRSNRRCLIEDDGSVSTWFS